MRRRDVCAGLLLAGFANASGKKDGFRTLFDGKTLRGWKRQPRSLAQPSLGRWIVEDGVIIGGQDPPGSGLGSYLVSEETFSDFELQIEARPDWRVDTGIMVRAVPQGNIGFQVLLDHRPHGGLGGYYGNADDWNHFRIRSIGAVPHLTTWINGEKTAELDTAKMKCPGWDPNAALEKVGRAGHIALEVHSNGAGAPFGKDRWAPGAFCRWRNISIKNP